MTKSTMIFALCLLLASGGCRDVIKLKQEAHVHVQLKDCRAQTEQYFVMSDSVTIIDMAHDSIVDAKTADHSGNLGEYDLPLGKYKIIFSNLFYKENDTVVSLADTGQYLIVLCMDELKTYPTNSIANLTTTDSITVRCESNGCFHSEARLLIIKKRASDVVASLYSIPTKISSPHKSKVLVAEAAIGLVAIDAFVRFENELQYVKDGSCTTTDEYTVSVGKSKESHRDGSCSWNGFSHLLAALFPNSLK